MENLKNINTKDPFVLCNRSPSSREAQRQALNKQVAAYTNSGKPITTLPAYYEVKRAA